MTDWQDAYETVLRAREMWLATGDDADHAHFDSVERAYRAKFKTDNCSGGVCDCTFNSDSHDSYRQDSSSMKSYSDYLKQTNGDTREAERLFNIDTHNSPRATVASLVRSDAADAEAEMKKHNRAQFFQPLSATKLTAKELQRQSAEQTDRIAQSRKQEAERKQFRAGTVRMDARIASPKCNQCNATLESDDVESGTCPSCKAESARKSMITRGQRAWRKPLQASNQRSDDPKDAA